MIETLSEYIWVYYALAFPIVIFSGSFYLQRRRRRRDFILVLVVSILFVGIGGIVNLSGHGPSGLSPPFWTWFIWIYDDPVLLIDPVGWFGILSSVFFSIIYVLPSLLIGCVLVAHFERWVSRRPGN